jgi:hypothetical protein
MGPFPPQSLPTAPVQHDHPESGDDTHARASPLRRGPRKVGSRARACRAPGARGVAGADGVAGAVVRRAPHARPGTSHRGAASPTRSPPPAPVRLRAGCPLGRAARGANASAESARARDVASAKQALAPVRPPCRLTPSRSRCRRWRGADCAPCPPRRSRARGRRGRRAAGVGVGSAGVLRATEVEREAARCVGKAGSVRGRRREEGILACAARACQAGRSFVVPGARLRRCSSRHVSTLLRCRVHPFVRW